MHDVQEKQRHTERYYQQTNRRYSRKQNPHAVLACDGVVNRQNGEVVRERAAVEMIKERLGHSGVCGQSRFVDAIYITQTEVQ